jgi:hypothetical protein
MKDKTLHNKRDWLNPKGHWDKGIISSKVSICEEGIDCNIDIWDCSRKISLSLDCYDKKSVVQRAKKLHLLIQHLQEVQKAMGEAYNIVMDESVFDKENDY